jgi:hypothetical protein
MKYIVQDSLDHEIIEAITTEVATEYLLIANQGVLSLARCMIEELQEPIFSKLFAQEWEQSNNNESLITVLTLTIQDYLNDLSEWLTYYHYTKLVKELLLLIIGHYIMSIRRKANGIFTFTNELIVANKIIKDRTLLYDYFIKLKEVLQRGGLRVTKKLTASGKVKPSEEIPHDQSMEQALNEALEPMYCFARIISCHNLQGAETDAKELFSRYGVDGLKVVQSCFLSNPCINRNDRSNYIDFCKKLFDDNNVHGVYSTTLMADYENYDTTITLQQMQKEAAQKRGYFWSSRK